MRVLAFIYSYLQSMHVSEAQSLRQCCLRWSEEQEICILVAFASVKIEDRYLPTIHTDGVRVARRWIDLSFANQSQHADDRSLDTYRR